MSAREVGTEGKLGGQATVRGRRRHLERPHRQREFNGEQSDGAGAQHRRGLDRHRYGYLWKKITVDVRGEILKLKDTINTMVDQLNAFAGEVTRVAREVAPKASSAARPWCEAWLVRGRT